MMDSQNARMQTASGLYYHFEDPKPSEIAVRDIAHQLANTCRFNGACRKHYSVAEHSVIVSRLCGKMEGTGPARSALLHDAPEAYLGDIVRYLKPLLGEKYVELTEKCERAIALAFNLEQSRIFKPASLKHADNLACDYEAHRLMKHWDGPDPGEAVGQVIDWEFPLSAGRAGRLFICELFKLGLGEVLHYAPPLASKRQTSSEIVVEQLSLLGKSKGEAYSEYESM